MVKIPSDAIISSKKLTRCLSVKKARNDKSEFLAQDSFSRDNTEALKSSIQGFAARNDAIADARNEYGVFYRSAGELAGVNGVNLSVITIQLQRQTNCKFQSPDKYDKAL